MNRTILITLVATGTVCAAVLISQGAKNRLLRERADEGEERIETLKRDLRRIEPLTAVVRSATLPGDGIEEAIAKSRASSMPEQRIERSKKQLGIIVEEMGDVSRSPAAFFKVLPDILRIIQDLSTDEMFELADSLDAPIDMSEPESAGVVRMILYMLVAENDPLRVIENSDLMGDREMRQSLLGQLARHDPEAARKWVANSDFSEDEKQAFNERLVLLAFREDIGTGVSLIREIRATEEGDSQFRSLQEIPIPVSQLPDLVAAANNPAFEDLRSDLVSMAIRSAMSSGGISSAREHVDVLNLSDTEVIALLQHQGLELVDADARGTLDWMSELPPTDQLSTVPLAVETWARRDFNAAGEWLGEMEPSEIKDASIRQFAETISQIDPRAAMLWSVQIQGELLRSSAIQRSAREWRRKDKDAAEAWLSENGYDSSGSRISEE